MIHPHENTHPPRHRRLLFGASDVPRFCPIGTDRQSHPGAHPAAHEKAVADEGPAILGLQLRRRASAGKALLDPGQQLDLDRALSRRVAEHLQSPRSYDRQPYAGNDRCEGERDIREDRDREYRRAAGLHSRQRQRGHASLVSEYRSRRHRLERPRADAQRAIERAQSPSHQGRADVGDARLGKKQNDPVSTEAEPGRKSFGP